MVDEDSNSTQRLRVAVAICTYRRNGPLRLLLEGLIICAARVAQRALVGVVIVDDTPEGFASEIVQQFADRFELGLQYRIAGHQNISTARNMALGTAMESADWIAMTDDDCEPDPDWLRAFLEVQERTGADAVTGLLLRRVPANSPRWLVRQPFLELGAMAAADGTEANTAATNCSMIASGWLKDHPEIRFDEDLGVLGGEDMVFYRQARAAGLRIHVAANAKVYEALSADRLTYRYQLSRFFWEGNSSYVTCVAMGVPRWRMFAHGAMSLARAVAHPVGRLICARSPQFRYSLALASYAAGKVIGTIGVRVAHH